jgi:hypothetical protein
MRSPTERRHLVRRGLERGLLWGLLLMAPGAALAVCPVGDLAGCRAACERGEAESCTRLGAIYRDGGNGVAKDDHRAVELFRQACRSGSSAACTDLQHMSAAGRGMRRVIGPANTPTAPPP